MIKILELLGLPASASLHASALDDFSAYVHLLMLVLFLGWLAFYVIALVKFRKSANPKAM